MKSSLNSITSREIWYFIGEIRHEGGKLFGIEYAALGSLLNGADFARCVRI
jgi:hypothetical protein